MTATRLLAKLEDFRLLPFFVVISMAIGIGIGKVLSISDFALTPRSMPSRRSSAAPSF